MVYVDLNSIMYSNAVRLSEWFKMFGPQEQARKYSKIANDLQEAIDKVFLKFLLVIKQSHNRIPTRPTP